MTCYRSHQANQAHANSPPRHSCISASISKYRHPIIFSTNQARKIETRGGTSRADRTTASQPSLRNPFPRIPTKRARATPSATHFFCHRIHTQRTKMPSDLPDYSKLNATSAGLAPGRGMLKGKKVLVVAGGQRKMDGIPGIDMETLPPSNGRAFSIVCGREGAAVAVHNRSLESAEATAELVRKEKDCPMAVSIAGDVTVEEEVKKIIAEAVEKLGGELDGIIVNVGDAKGAAGLDLSVEDLEYTIRLNFLSHFMFCKLV